MRKKLDLQLFAEVLTGAGSTADAETTGDADMDGIDNQTQSKDKAAEPEKKYTDADVDKLLDRKFAEWQKKQQQAVAQAEKLATMNATQRAEHERDQLKKELEELKRKDTLSEMMKETRKMFSDNGVSVSDELLSVLVTTDAENTKNAADSFIKLYKAAVEAGVKERLRGESPRKGTSGDTVSMTKEQIMAIRDPELRQKKMLENKSLFNF